ncbi:MAG: energy transducer TonB [Acidobacteria bacterium]|nr:energy transducer TonB [Acidobacteriota bacterium]
MSIPDIVLTPEMEQARIDGRITVSLSIDEKGTVTSAELTSGPLWPCGKNPRKELNDFRTLAETALRAARFSPKVENGKPVSTRIAATLLIGNVLKSEKRKDAVSKGEAIDPEIHGPDVEYHISVAIGRAKPVDIPKPPYPVGARVNRVEGVTQIDFITDEKGKVILAGHVAGDPLLLPASRDTACKAKFSAPLVNGKPIRTMARMTYTFIAPR